MYVYMYVNIVCVCCVSATSWAGYLRMEAAETAGGKSLGKVRHKIKHISDMVGITNYNPQ